MDANTKLPPMAEALMQSQADNRKWMLVIASVLGLLIFALVVAVWVGVGVLGKLTQPQITMDQAVSSGYVDILQLENGATGYHWKEGPDTYLRVIDDQRATIAILQGEVSLKETELKLHREDSEGLRTKIKVLEQEHALILEENVIRTEEIRHMKEVIEQLNGVFVPILPADIKKDLIIEPVEPATPDDKKSKWNPREWFKRNK